jgi:Protein of unknown function (DUF2934)
LAVASPEQIARLAYSYWEARGRTHGSALEDWLRAERDLMLRRPVSRQGGRLEAEGAA